MKNQIIYDIINNNIYHKFSDWYMFLILLNLTVCLLKRINLIIIKLITFIIDLQLFHFNGLFIISIIDFLLKRDTINSVKLCKSLVSLFLIEHWNKFRNVRARRYFLLYLFNLTFYLICLKISAFPSHWEIYSH